MPERRIDVGRSDFPGAGAGSSLPSKNWSAMSDITFETPERGADIGTGTPRLTATPTSKRR